MSPATEWHIQRRKKILKAHPEVALLPKHNPWTIASIFLISCGQLMAAYWCQYLPLWAVLLLGWALGGWLASYMFSNAHELLHRLVHPKIAEIGGAYEFLMRLATLPSFSLQNYLLYRWGHLKHHGAIAATPVNEASQLLQRPHCDIELLMDQYYYCMIFEKGESPRFYIGKYFKNKFIRFVFFLLIPVIVQVRGMLATQMGIPILLVKGLFDGSSAEQKRVLHSAAIQLALMIAILVGLYLTAGIKPVIYLLLAELALMGFLFYPISLFYFVTHKTFKDGDQIQPTCSYYGRVTSLFCGNINHHVEHHDFTDIPRRYLPQVRKLAPEFYDSLHSYDGMLHCFAAYFTAEDWYYGGVVDA